MIAWARDDPPTPNTDQPQPSISVQPTPAHIDDHTALLSPRPSGSLRSFNPSASSSNQQTPPQPPNQSLAPDDPASHTTPSESLDPRGQQGWWSYVPFPLRKTSQGSAYKRKPSDAPTTPPADSNSTDAETPAPTNKPNGLTLSLPSGPFTVNQTQTPGWETPWAPHPPAAYRGGGGANGSAVRERGGDGSQFYAGGKELGAMGSRRTAGGDDDDGRSRRGGKWARTKRRLRVYILQNNYVPLVSLSFICLFLYRG